jgi:hypothetical protein
MKPFPARLHVLLAADSTRAVVLRRGPSKQSCSFLWDRRDDSVTLGQWIKARIYERRSDISPDGRYLIYFAMNGRWKSETLGSWTAVSQAPWLKALDLYAKGDCWEGGGLFLTRSSYWLNDRYFSPARTLRTDSGILRRDDHKPEQAFGAEDTGVYYPRLMRDGWTLVGRRKKPALDREIIFEKPLPNGWLLRKIAHEQVGSPPGKGCYWDEHELVDATGNIMPRPDWAWSELDDRRLVWAERGCLYHASCKRRGLLGPTKLIHDFNPYRFAAIEAPY